jgi:sterol desaturase/sphingolipid hydroxylase (fatty acid hydroxylase superfamily)
MSPAHHHIHHSVDPKHFGSNMGGCLAIFDWMFGTLIVPERQRQRLRFGVEDANAPAPHTLQHGLLAPFWRAGTGLLAAIRRPSAAARPAPDLARSG